MSSIKTSALLSLHSSSHGHLAQSCRKKIWQPTNTHVTDTKSLITLSRILHAHSIIFGLQIPYGEGKQCKIYILSNISKFSLTISIWHIAADSGNPHSLAWWDVSWLVWSRQIISKEHSPKNTFFVSNEYIINISCSSCFLTWSGLELWHAKPFVKLFYFCYLATE